MVEQDVWISPIANIMDLRPRIRAYGLSWAGLAVLKSFAGLENPIVSRFVRCKMREDMPVVLAISLHPRSTFQPALGAIDYRRVALFDSLNQKTDTLSAISLEESISCVLPLFSAGLQFY